MTTPTVFIEQIGGYLQIKIPLAPVTGLREAQEVKSQLQTVVSTVIDNFEKRTVLLVESVGRLDRTIEGRGVWQVTVKL